MPRQPIRQPMTEARARLMYLQDAAYYFLRATGEHEQMVSALNRLSAQAQRKILDAHRWHVPSAAEIHGFAVELFGIDRVHPLTIPPLDLLSASSVLDEHRALSPDGPARS